VAKIATVNIRERFGSSEGPRGPLAPGREPPAGSFIHAQAPDNTDRANNMIPPSDQLTVSNALAVSSISAASASPHGRVSSGQCRTAHASSHRAKRADVGISCLPTLMPRSPKTSKNAAPAPHESLPEPTPAQFQPSGKGAVAAALVF